MYTTSIGLDVKSVFRDTAKETLNDGTKEVTDSQDEYEKDIAKTLKDLDLHIFLQFSHWATICPKQTWQV